MSRKHFERLAQSLRSVRPEVTPESKNDWTLYLQWKASVDAIAAACKASNPRFDTHRFGDACGVY